MYTGATDVKPTTPYLLLANDRANSNSEDAANSIRK